MVLLEREGGEGPKHYRGTQAGDKRGADETMERADWELVRKRTYWNLHVIKWLVHQARPCLRGKGFSCEAGGSWTSGKGQEINDAYTLSATEPTILSSEWKSKSSSSSKSKFISSLYALPMEASKAMATATARITKLTTILYKAARTNKLDWKSSSQLYDIPK